jgi:putative ABC transport system substrate-binding protein
VAARSAGAADGNASGRSPGRRLSGVQASYVVAFHRGLKETGCAEGENLRVEQRWARGNLTQVPALADELIRHTPAVIVTVGGTSIAKAVKATGTAIPIVFALGSDPVEDGLVASMNRAATSRA